MLEAAAIVVDAAMLLLHLCNIFICPCACAKPQRLTTATMIVVSASMPVALCLYGTGVLTLDGAHHGNKATNSNREYSEHVFTIAMNIFAMANGFVLYVIMKVEIHSHVVISFSSIRHARTYMIYIYNDLLYNDNIIALFYCAEIKKRPQKL